ncbi:acyl-CoA dehydrogenase family protein [Actibacterium sp.]|uniref:acyl-CoA dehydrogenase family protein n=1 Tax=Actibacterium sp. TaxID=1872125 RepID=UPI00356470B8
MDFSYSDKVNELRRRVSDFMDDYVIPRHRRFVEEAHQGTYTVSFLNDLKALAREEGLWNLFLPHLKEGEPGTRLSTIEYAPLAEIMGQLPWASEVFNCSAPDTGNMELIHMFGTPEQKKRWLEPLLNGDIRSCFAMTEPDVASSDATNVTTVIKRDGDDYVINGRKWFITGAASPNCKVAIVMGKTDLNADIHRQQSMILVPMDTPGMNVVRNISVMNHLSYESHCEIVFKDCRVPASALLGGEGEGFAMAQARLGPGRIHHCMRSIGQAELALKLMVERSLERKTFGKYLHEQGVVQEMIAKSRCEIEQARLLVLKAAWMIDNVGAKGARDEIAMIKVVIPQMQLAVTDRAMQVFGAMGLSPDTPLPDLWTMSRALRIADGPDEVHLRAIAKGQIKAAQKGAHDSGKFFTPPDRASERSIRADQIDF